MGGSWGAGGVTQGGCKGRGYWGGRGLIDVEPAAAAAGGNVFHSVPCVPIWREARPLARSTCQSRAWAGLGGRRPVGGIRRGGRGCHGWAAVPIGYFVLSVKVIGAILSVGSPALRRDWRGKCLPPARWPLRGESQALGGPPTGPSDSNWMACWPNSVSLVSSPVNLALRRRLVNSLPLPRMMIGLTIK